MNSAIHLCLNSKGGVGKSFTCTVLAQHLMKKSQGTTVFCADTDPTTPTFSAYPAFNARHINIMTPDMNIDKSKFDQLVELLLTHDGDCVVDNGASSFLPVMAYIMENGVIDFLLDAGKQVFIHAPIVGGLGMDETLRGLDLILRHQRAPVVVWENAFLFGPIEKNGKRFNDSMLYNNNKDRIAGIVHLPQRSADTFMRDLHIMTSNRLTFKEAADSELFKTAMQKQRLVMVERDIAGQLEAIGL